LEDRFGRIVEWYENRRFHAAVNPTPHRAGC
jgi:hypothetical protein